MRRSNVFCAFGLLLLTSGCTVTGRSPPTHFYILPGPPGAGEVAPIRQLIGIAPIRLPRYLDRPQIVTFEDASRIRLAEFHRWAEPLTDGFTRVLSEGLATRLPRSRVVSLPARRLPLNWTVEIQVRDLRVGGNRCLLLADWRLRRGKELLAWQRTAIEQPVAGEGYPAVAAAMGRAVDALAARLAAELAAGSES